MGVVFLDNRLSYLRENGGINMKSTRKLISLLVALTLIVVVFSACGSSASLEETASAAVESAEAAVEEAAQDVEAAAETAVSASESTEPDDAGDVEATPAEEAAASAEEPPEEAAAVEEGPKKLPVGDDFPFVNDTMEMPITTEDITLTYWAQFMPPLYDYGYHGYEDFPVFQYLERLTGVHFEYTSVSMDSAGEQAQLLIASGDYPDIWQSFAMYYTGTPTQAVEDEIAIDLAQYKDQMPNYFGLLDTYEELGSIAYTQNGEVPYLLGMYRNVDARDGNALRGDWLDQLGMDLPVTYDEYHEVLKAMNSEFGGTLYMTADNEALFAPGFDLNIAFWGGGFGNFMLDEDDQVYYSLTGENYRDYLTYMNGLWNDGLLYRDFVTNHAGGVDNGQLLNGDYAMLSRYTVTFYGTVESMVSPGDTFYLKSTRAAMKEPGQMFHVGDPPAYITMSGGKILSTKLLEDPEKLDIALKWVDFWYTREGSDIGCYGEEGVSYTRDADGNVQFTEVITNNPDGMSFTMAMLTYAMSNGTFVADPEINTISFSEVQRAMYDDYVDAKVNGSDYAYQLPTSLALGVDDSAAFNSVYTDIITYAQECYLKFITGELNLDSDFDAYVASVQDMGIDTCIDLLQKQYDSMS